VRGKFGAEDSASSWYVRLRFYDSSGASLGYADASTGGADSLDPNWHYRGGRVTTPANTTSVRVSLINHLNSGWVAFDDVVLTADITSAATICCKTYLLGGQPVATSTLLSAAMRASGYPAGETGKNDLFYLHSDRASTLRRAQGP
jgi:hypothetical protein